MPDAPFADPASADLPTDGLNPDQLDAVVHRGGPLLVVAGAGSGKTRVLTHRIAHLIHEGVRPSGILAITFTNKAADEMRQRVAALVGPVTGAMWVCTFHSACVRILRANADRLGYPRQFSIYDQADAVRLTGYVIRDLGLDAKRFRPRGVHASISRWKNELVEPDDAAAGASTSSSANTPTSTASTSNVCSTPGRWTSTICSSTPSGCSATPRRARALPGPLRAHPRRRVPGHQSGPERDRADARRRPPQRLRRRRHGPMPAARHADPHPARRRPDRSSGWARGRRHVGGVDDASGVVTHVHRSCTNRPSCGSRAVSGDRSDPLDAAPHRARGSSPLPAPTSST